VAFVQVCELVGPRNQYYSLAGLLYILPLLKKPQSMQLRSTMRLQLSVLWTILLLPALLGRCCADVDCEARLSYTICLNGLDNSNDEELMCKDSKVIYVPMGSEETLVCQVLRDVEVDFSGGWEFYPSNGSNMVPNVQANHPRITAETNRLTIANIQPEDEGLYACVAKEGDNVQRTIIAGCVIVHGTARSYDDTTENITARSGEDVILPTAVVFQNTGYCGVNPEYTQARLRYEPNKTVLFHCLEMPCLADNDTHSYDFSALGNVTLHAPVNPGPYFMALIQMCPSPVLKMTYNVIIIGSQTPTLSPTASKGPTKPNPRKSDAVIVIVVVVVAVVVIVGVAFAALFLYIFCKRWPQTFALFVPNKEPVYEDPNRMTDGVELVDQVQLQRQESLYSGQFPPSTIGGDKNGMGPYEMDIHLNEKPTDELGSI
jgi:hypothetical protein